jgi:hypothetical protein
VLYRAKPERLTPFYPNIRVTPIIKLENHCLDAQNFDIGQK